MIIRMGDPKKWAQYRMGLNYGDKSTQSGWDGACEMYEGTNHHWAIQVGALIIMLHW